MHREKLSGQVKRSEIQKQRGRKVQEEIITLIENSIGRSIEEIKNNENDSLYSHGINSFEMVQIVVEIEEKYGVSLDNLLSRLNRVSLSELCDEINRLVSAS